MAIERQEKKRVIKRQEREEELPWHPPPLRPTAFNSFPFIHMKSDPVLQGT
jgi:hypothetical protein